MNVLLGALEETILNLIRLDGHVSRDEMASYFPAIDKKYEFRTGGRSAARFIFRELTVTIVLYTCNT